MSRVIRKSRANSSNEAHLLLGALLATELIRPAKALWMISPWISDIPLLDNSVGTYTPLARWGARRVLLAEILVTLATHGTTVVVGTTADNHNRRFLDHLQTLAVDWHVADRTVVDIDPDNELHAKSIVSDDYVLVGSMNLTMNGVYLREEYLELKTEAELVAQARMDAFERFGGVL